MVIVLGKRDKRTTIIKAVGLLGITHAEHLAGSRLWLTVLSDPNYGARMSKIGRPAASRLPRKRSKPFPAQKNLDLFSGTQDHEGAVTALRESEERYRQIVEQIGRAHV